MSKEKGLNLRWLIVVILIAAIFLFAIGIDLNNLKN